MKKLPLPLGFLALFHALALHPVGAQVGPDPTQIYAIPDPGPGVAISWGDGLAAGPDLTGDGVPECLLPRVDTSEAVTLHVLDPVRNQYIQVLTGFGQRIGASGQGYYHFPDTFAGNAGDVNGDGTEDIYFANPRMSLNPHMGTVWIVSGADYSILHQVAIPTPGDPSFPDLAYGGHFFGALGDLNGDGKAEFAVTTLPGGSQFVTDIHSGADGAVLLTFPTTGVRSMGDVNGDGVNDLVYGIQFSHAIATIRAAEIVSGVDGAQLQHFAWNQPCQLGILSGGCMPGGEFAYSSSIPLPIPLSDIDGDLVPDVVFFDPWGSASAQPRAYSSATGDLLWTALQHCNGCNYNVPHSIGTRLEDVDQDGVLDFAYAVTHQRYENVHSGASGALLLQRPYQNGYDGRWQSIASIGYLNGHGCYATIIRNEIGQVLLHSYQACVAPPPPPLKRWSSTPSSGGSASAP